jgi:hypothetical protein
MINYADLSPSFQGCTLEIIAYLLNGILTKFIDKTPHEI